MPGDILSERRGAAAWLTISCPPRNLFAPDNMGELVARLAEADEQEDIRAVVLTGAGDTFCGGLDGAELIAKGNAPEFGNALVALLRLIPTLGKPVISAINGDALAAGFSLAVVTDWAVAVEDAKLGTFEASIGRWPMLAQVPALQRLLPRHALSNIITGEPFTAQRALEVGAINAVVPGGQLVEEIEALIPRLTSANSTALASGRRSFYRFVDMPYDDALEAALGEFVASFSTPAA